MMVPSTGQSRCPKSEVFSVLLDGVALPPRVSARLRSTSSNAMTLPTRASGHPEAAPPARLALRIRREPALGLPFRRLRLREAARAACVELAKPLLFLRTLLARTLDVGAQRQIGRAHV